MTVGQLPICFLHHSHSPYSHVADLQVNHEALSSLQDTEWPSVAEFYAHRDILITGSTGFMGKCLGEKLLRSVPELGCLLVLVLYRP